MNLPIVSLAEYSRAAGRTITPDQDNGERIMNAALGLTGEAGEVADLVKKMRFHGKTLDANTMRDELGDVLWYINQMAHAFGLTLQEVAQANVDKLRKRYPDGFVPGGGVR